MADISTRMQRILENAISVAEESNCQVKMGAIVFRSGKILGRACNKKGYRGRSIHAEVNACRELRYQKRTPKGTEILVARERPSGGWGNAKPCATCIEWMRLVGVRRVWWTTVEQTLECATLSSVENQEYIPCDRHYS